MFGKKRNISADGTVEIEGGYYSVDSKKIIGEWKRFECLDTDGRSKELVARLRTEESYGREAIIFSPMNFRHPQASDLIREVIYILKSFSNKYFIAGYLLGMQRNIEISKKTYTLLKWKLIEMRNPELEYNYDEYFDIIRTSEVSKLKELIKIWENCEKDYQDIMKLKLK